MPVYGRRLGVRAGPEGQEVWVNFAVHWPKRATPRSPVEELDCPSHLLDGELDLLLVPLSASLTYHRETGWRARPLPCWPRVVKAGILRSCLRGH